MISTYLPMPSFRDSVQVLSDEHLGLQRLHVLELMEFFHDVETSRLPNDYKRSGLDDDSNIVKMWYGYELQLCEYGIEACEEWMVRRGKKDKILEALYNHLEWGANEESNMNKPNWFGDIDFHTGHQAELLRLDPEYYKGYFMVETGRELVWPKSDQSDA